MHELPNPARINAGFFACKALRIRDGIKIRP